MRPCSRFCLALSFLCVLVVAAGCPAPLEPSSEAKNGSRVAPDSVAVLRLPRLERAERAAKLYLEGTRGQQRSDLEAMLSLVVGGRSPGTALLGFDGSEALLVSWRPSGEPLVWLPVENERLFSVALERLLSAQGASRGDDLLAGVRVYRGPEGEVSMLARMSEKGALLWPAPSDPFAAAALLDALATGRLSGRWPTGAEPPPHESAAAELYAGGEGVRAISPSLAALFGGGSALTSARGQLFVDEGALRLELQLSLDDVAYARLLEQTRGSTEVPAGFCALDERALASLRFPVALLRSDGTDEGPLDELTGALAIALLPREQGAPGWIALSRPRGLVARDALLASVQEAGVVEKGQERVGRRTVRLFSAPGTSPGASDEGTLRVIADEDLFALAFAAEDALRGVVEESAPCEDARGAALHLVVEPRALAAALPSTPGGSAPDALGAEAAINALGRLAARLPSAFERLEGSASLDDGTVTLHVRGSLSGSPSAPQRP